LYCSAKVRAKRDNVPFTLRIEDIQIPEFCPVFPKMNLTCAHRGESLANSPTLDRLIPSLGYTKNNVRVISHKANTIKTDATAEEILKVGNWLKKELSND
jgi:hypothetical protein